MDPFENADENHRLRRTMRDLVALSTLPAIWVGLSPEKIARSLIDVLFTTLSLDLIYIRLVGLTGAGVIEDWRDKQARDDVRTDIMRTAMAPLLASVRTDPPAQMQDPFGTEMLNIAVTRFGVSEHHGVLITGSRNAAFPSERDRLLLGVGA